MDWLLPALPVPTLVAFAVLAVAPVPLSPRTTHRIAIAASATTVLAVLPFALACLLHGRCTVGPLAVTSTPEIGAIDHALGVVLDPLGLVTAATVALVSLMVVSFATAFMRGEGTADQRRFFALMALFETAMLTLVIAADAVVLFLGWELVGLCSFFLIAYDTRSAASLAAGRKAFVMTRIADAALFAGLALLFVDNDTIQLAAMTESVETSPDARDKAALALILVGALGKSAQVPLQTWLPDAMAGPVPVSALLHSATMVAAGVFLLARFAPVMEAVPAIGYATTGLGLATALLGGVAALAQNDIKRLLAYSTVSQIGYMVMAVGVGAVGAAMAHFAMHAAFKALLFLSAGLLSEAAGHSRELADLRGSRRRAPGAFWAFAAGAVSLAGLPFLSAGWFSKEAILAALWGAGAFGPMLWTGAVLGAGLTAGYARRPLIALARAPLGHAGEGRGPSASDHSLGAEMAIPLAVLSAMALAGGLGVEALARFVAGGETGGHAGAETLLLAGGIAAAVLGAALAVLLAARARTFAGSRAAAVMRGGLGIDALYRRRVVAPASAGIAAIADDPAARGFVAAVAAPVGPVATLAANDPLGRRLDASRSAMSPARRALGDRAERAFAALARLVARLARRSRRLLTGRARDYAVAAALGAALLLGLATGMAWN
ncbi:MAG: NADH-quinone oxidoreductase subunit L [Paracoccaceae bacterium]